MQPQTNLLEASGQANSSVTAAERQLQKSKEELIQRIKYMKEKEREDKLPAMERQASQERRAKEGRQIQGKTVERNND